MTKVKRGKECSLGNHVFIISNWVVTATSQKANAYTCQKCLHTIEGKFDVDIVRKQIHAVRDGEAEAS